MTGIMSTEIRNQSVKESRWIWLFSLLVIIVTSIPYLVGFSFENLNLHPGNKWIFSGFIFGVEDGNSYIAKALRGSTGDWLFHTPYTAFPQRGLLAFLPYILMGKFVSPPGQHEQLIALLHIFRAVSIVLVVFATYEFISIFTTSISYRRLGLFWAIFGGGLGWLVVMTGNGGLFGSMPLEFYSPETFGFLSIYGIPHLIIARACMLWSIVRYINLYGGSETTITKEGLIIGALWLAVAFAQPLTAGVLGILIGGHFIIIFICIKFNWLKNSGVDIGKILAVILMAGFLPAIFILYNIWSFSSDPFLKQWTSQNIISSPHPLHYLIAYGLLLPFAWMGGKDVYDNKNIKGFLLVYWVILIPFLAYAPTNLQRRLPEGSWVALIALSIVGLNTVQREKTVRFSKWPSWILTALLLPGSIILIIGGISAASNPGIPLFRPEGEILAFEYIREHSRPNDVVLASYETGNVLPAWAPVYVVIGHGPESIHLQQLSVQVDNFFKQVTINTDRIQLLEDLKIRYVFWGPFERSLGDWNPAEAKYLLAVYENDGYSVYEYIKSR